MLQYQRIAWLQERVESGDFTVEHIPGKYMCADMNTKVIDVTTYSMFMSFLYGNPIVVGD